MAPIDKLIPMGCSPSVAPALHGRPTSVYSVYSVYSCDRRESYYTGSVHVSGRPAGRNAKTSHCETLGVAWQNTRM